MAAVTPEPQVVIAGFDRSTPAASNTARQSSGDFIVASLFSKLPNGTLREPGMWPDRNPSRGSASDPEKRPAERASMISWSRTARWLHVRIRDEGTRVNFSLPLPLRPAAWLVRLARPWVPQLRDTPVDELILSMAEMEEEGILALEVSEGDGEEVQVYFG